MAKLNDVARYLLSKHGAEIEQMRLQKLLYYCQVWSVAVGQGILFPNEIQAWVNGPVVPDFWRQHPYEYNIRQIDGNSNRLSVSERNLIDKVYDVYGKYSGVQLSEMTHNEDPWLNARRGLPGFVRSSQVIDPIAAGEYYKRRIAQQN